MPKIIPGASTSPLMLCKNPGSEIVRVLDAALTKNPELSLKSIEIPIEDDSLHGRVSLIADLKFAGHNPGLILFSDIQGFWSNTALRAEFVLSIDVKSMTEQWTADLACSSGGFDGEDNIDPLRAYADKSRLMTFMVEALMDFELTTQVQDLIAKWESAAKKQADLKLSEKE